MVEMEKLLNCQAQFVRLENYEDEFITMQQILRLEPEVQEIFRQTSLEWMNALNPSIQSDSNAARSEKSRRLREEGNSLIKNKLDKRNVLAACNQYTKAIFSAPANSDALALAHANRAVALQEFGYYREAYDDCECALANNYPESMRHKVITRQAYCSWRLGERGRLKEHLDALDKMQLNLNFQRQINELHAAYQQIQSKEDAIEELSVNEITKYRESQEIVSTSGPRGRYMTASRDIGKGELIFVERASSFVPVNESRICQQCAAVQIIPFPCKYCLDQVVYCSVQCRQAHAGIHAYECVGYQRKFFQQIGISHLAFRVLLDGLPEIVAELGEIKTAREMWSALSQGGRISQGSSNYSLTLQMVTHLHQMTLNDVLWFALVANVLLLYLKEFTNFFHFVKNTAASLKDWELITASLILRHIGQLISNAHSYTSLIPLQNKSSEFSLLRVDLWQGAFHVQRGQLHNFSNYEEISAVNFPYLSICNHACEASFRPKFSGRFLYTYASGNISRGHEIFNCYTLDYRKMKKATRQGELRGVHKFVCQCNKCVKDKPDEEFEKFHLYRCENPNCCQEFVPKLPQLRGLNWWDPAEGLAYDKNIHCTKCKTEQHCEWLLSIQELLNCTQNPPARLLLYKKFQELDKWLLNYHELKLELGLQIVVDCFAAYKRNANFTQFEFDRIADILKFYLRGSAERCSPNSIEFTAGMTYLWDFIALGFCKCSMDEMQGYLNAAEIISDEVKRVFLNYYEDYIRDNLIE